MKRFSKEIKFLLLVLLIVVFSSGCGCKWPVTVSIINEAPLDSIPQETLMGAAARVDITPPPGMPMAGHSMFSKYGKGVRTKLTARVIYLKPADGRPVALVQCDLLFGSRLLHHKVAELVASKTDIEAGGLLMAASHTHSAPGNFFGSNLYNNFAANEGGFNEEYFEFLSERIASAVIEAYSNRRPAKIASGSITVTDKVTVNRSFRAFLRNKDLEDKTKLNKFSAVNPVLNIIRIDCKDDDGMFKPRAAFTNFSIHSNTNPKHLDKLYNGDVTSYIQRCFESEIKRLYNLPWEPLHAVANFTHADNNPFYGDGVKENFKDFRRVGCLIALKALECFRNLDDDLTGNAVIRYITKEIDLFKERTVEGVKIVKRPKMGWAGLGGGGGKGRRTPFSYLPFIAPGWPRWIFTKGEHGHKRVILGPLQYLIMPKKNLPRYAFLQVIRVHDTVLMAVPWEVTYQLGKRILRHACSKGEEAGLEKSCRFVVVSCSNGAFGYVNTPEEYTRQHFEGGFNLYGPNTGDFIKLHLGNMVTALADGKNLSTLPEKWTFKLKAAEFYPEELKPRGKREIHREPFFKPGKKRSEPYWGFLWYDVPPYYIDFHRPLVAVQVSDDEKTWISLKIDGYAVDDSGPDVAVRFLDDITQKNMGLYECRWFNFPGGGNRFYRFVIQPREGLSTFYSPAFKTGR